MKRIFNGSGGRKAALILSLCLIFALAVGTTLAYLKANTSPVTNTFKAATSEIKIEEKTDDGIKSEIYVKNEGTATSYVRVKLVCNWVDKDGNVTVGAPTVEGAKVVCQVISNLVKGDKVLVFHKKRRKGYRKLNGHRQQFTELTITEVVA